MGMRAAGFIKRRAARKTRMQVMAQWSGVGLARAVGREQDLAIVTSAVEDCTELCTKNAQAPTQHTRQPVRADVC